MVHTSLIHSLPLEASLPIPSVLHWALRCLAIWICCKTFGSTWGSSVEVISWINSSVSVSPLISALATVPSKVVPSPGVSSFQDEALPFRFQTLSSQRRATLNSATLMFLVSPVSKGLDSRLCVVRSFDGIAVYDTRVLHSHKPASPSRVSASCPTALHCSLFLVQASTVCERVANPFDCPCTNKNDHVVLDQSSRKQPHRTTAGSRSPARARAFLIVVPTRESTPHLESGVWLRAVYPRAQNFGAING